MSRLTRQDTNLKMNIENADLPQMWLCKNGISFLHSIFCPFSQISSFS